MALHAIAYVSQAMHGLSIDDVDDLARDAATHNSTAGVTGLLVYDGRRFLQYIEGPSDGLSLIYSRIMNSTRHTDIVELARGRTTERRFPYWSMRYIPATEGELKLAAFSDWTGLAVTRPGIRREPTAVDHLSALAAPYIN